MQGLRYWIHALGALVVVCAAAGGAGCSDDDGSGPSEGEAQPVELSMEALEGYWAGLSNIGDAAVASASQEPLVLHIRPGTAEEDGPWIGELLQGGASEPYGFVSLSGTRLFHTPNPTSEGLGVEFEITELTTEGFRFASYSNGLTYEMRRQSGCSGLGSAVEAPGQARTAAVGPDGAVHVVTGGSQFLGENISGNHMFRRAGDCAFRPSGLGGEAVDVGPDGNVRFLRGGSGLPLVYMEAEWSGSAWTVVSQEDVSPGYGGTYALAHDVDGTPIVVAGAGGELGAFRRGADGWTFEVLPIRHIYTLNPLVIRVVYDADGYPVVQPERADRAARWNGTAWEAWSFPRLPDDTEAPLVVAWTPDGELVGGFSGGRFGRYDGTEWTLTQVGVGDPWGLHVWPDGAVDMVVVPNPEGSRIMAMVSFALDADPLLPTQRYIRPLTNNQSATQGDNVFKWYPVVEFGGDGVTYASGHSGGVRDRSAESELDANTLPTTFTFEEGAVGTITVPSLGVSCSETCTVELPWNQAIWLEGTSDVGRLQLTGAPDLYFSAATWTAYGDGRFTVYTVRPYYDQTTPGEGNIGVKVIEDRIRLAEPVPDDLPEFVGSQPLAVERFPDGDVLVVVSTAEGLVIQRREDASGAVTSSYTGCPLSPGFSISSGNATSAAALESGAVLAVTVAAGCEDGIGAAGSYVLWLDPDLSVRAAQPLDRAEHVTITDEGDALLFSNRYDSSIPREWAEMVVMPESGESTTVELDAGRLGTSFWGVSEGFVMLRNSEDVAVYDRIGTEAIPSRSTGIAAFDLDGSVRWVYVVPSHFSFPSPAISAASVYEGDFVLAMWMSEALEIDGRTPAREGEPLAAGSTWALAIDPASGDVLDDIVIPPGVAHSLALPLQDGAWGFIASRKGGNSYLVARDDALVDERYYDRSPPVQCWNNGCPARRAFAVPSATGAWVLTENEAGYVEYDGFTLDEDASRATLTLWDITGALD